MTSLRIAILYVEQLRGDCGSEAAMTLLACIGEPYIQDDVVLQGGGLPLSRLPIHTIVSDYETLYTWCVKISDIISYF